MYFSTRRDSISKDSIDLPVFKPQMTSRVIEDYSEVVNCAQPPKVVRHKSSSSRTTSNSDSIKEQPEETPVPLGSYETVAMVSDSVVTSGFYPTVVHNCTITTVYYHVLYSPITFTYS